MKLNVSNATWHEVASVGSTQDLASEFVKSGKRIGVVTTGHQTSGRGRLGRTWHADPGDSLAMSLILWDYKNHPKPYLVGMAVAIAAAGALHCQLRWPNDLVVGPRKLGGILTELVRTADGSSIPVVGVGVNLNQASFPEEIAEIATSLHLTLGGSYVAADVTRGIVKRLAQVPEPSDWSDLADIWGLFDTTPGRKYRLFNGDEAIGLGIGSDGSLLCSVNGESMSVLAAEAIFGPVV